MEIERVITKYNNSDDSFEEEFNIDSISFEEILTVFSPREDDPLLYQPYEINLEQAEWIRKYLPSFAFDFLNYAYLIEAYSAKE